MNPTLSTVRRGIPAGMCLATIGVAFAAGAAAAFQAEAPKPAAPPIDYQALEQPPQNGIRLSNFLQGVPESQRTAKEWKFYERDGDGDGWLSAEEAANDDPTNVSAIVKRFRALDVDASGFLSLAEYVEPADSQLQGEPKANFVQAPT